MAKKIDSASDDRTANNAARHQYRKLTDAEKAAMMEIKDRGAGLIGVICALDGEQNVQPDNVRLNDRNLELARQAAEDAVMRAVRFITG
ncbi:hypothetical protein [Roseovarius sp. MMSF_3281]|uniref:Acb2/Tad1 domain-containing protein n=1 Tax=Roseovarius sp. MMSF_3281 TaxID=3046694 RepID=UPI00273D7F6B|nr:hypothetical protein [Roseovarius sp. MMSF_3281]